MRRSSVLLASKAASATADRFFLGSKPVGAWLSELKDVLADTHGYSPKSVAIATSLDPTSPSPERNIASKLGQEPYFPGIPAVPLGGLGGLPALGKHGFQLFRQRAAADGRNDWLLVYGSSAYINAAGEVRTNVCATGAAFEMVDAAGGISGLPDDAFSDKHDSQQARLMLEVARAYEPDLVVHPEPEARLAYVNFAAVQSSLREVVDWSAVEPGIRLAALGGITIHLEGGEGDEGSPPPPPSPESSDVAEDDTNSNSKGVGRYNQEPLFLPLSFELLDPEAGALHDLLDDLELHRKRRRTALAALAEGVGLSSAESGESADEGGGSKSGGGRSKGMLSRARWWKASSPPPRLHQDLLFPMAVMDDGQEEDGDEGSGTGESRDGRN